MKKDLYTKKDCECYSTSEESVSRKLLGKLNKFRMNSMTIPKYAILDKKTYKQLEKEVGEHYIDCYLSSVFGLQIKVIKSKEPIIFVGI